MPTAPELTVPNDSPRGARRLKIGDHSFYYSGSDCIAYQGPAGRFRRGMGVENWRRHGILLGIDDFPCVSLDEFTSRLPSLMVRA
jgi:hypothetical protein